MLKKMSKTLLVLSFTSSAFGQTEMTTARLQKTPEDQFATYVMKGFNGAIEYSSMNAEMQIKVSNPKSEETVKGNTNTPAGALGVSINYAHLPRNSAGWSAGATILSKIENGQSPEKSSLKSVKSFTQIQPEGNLGYALSNGIWGMVGGHLSGIVGNSEFTDSISRIGIGAQASIGFTPIKNFGMDIGYSVSVHRFSESFVNDLKSMGSSVDELQSWIKFSQLRARATYYF